MTDLEMTKLCAEAMGYSLREFAVGDAFELRTIHDRQIWDPLGLDAQAMALVKRFRLRISQAVSEWEATWSEPGQQFSAWHSDLNRAIVECVAKMQAAKVTA